MLKIGQMVNLQIDDVHRKKCAISHTAGHVLADILEFTSPFSMYKAKSTQGHHFPGGEYIKAIMLSDIENKEIFIKELNTQVAKAINNDIKISVGSCENVRHIKIGESNRMCGGTHLNSTKDINNCTVTKVKTSKVLLDGSEKFEATIYYNC